MSKGNAPIVSRYFVSLATEKVVDAWLFCPEMAAGMLKIDGFLSKLTRAYPGMREIWLLASPVKGRRRYASAWKLLAFADEDTFQQLRRDVRFKRADVELLIVRDGDEFREPWGDNSEPGYLSEWQWVKTSEREAQYYGTKWVQDEKLGRAIVELCKASLLWPAG